MNLITATNCNLPYNCTHFNLFKYVSNVVCTFILIEKFVVMLPLILEINKVI